MAGNVQEAFILTPKPNSWIKQMKKQKGVETGKRKKGGLISCFFETKTN